VGFNDVLTLMVTFGIGGGLVLVAVYVASRAVASRSWPEAPGEVTWTNLRIRGRVNTRTMWVPEVTYDYRVEGGRYSGKRLRFAVWGLDGEGREFAQARLKPYSLRAPIIVRYNPEYPGDSVIETRPDWKSIGLCAALGVMFIAFGMYLTLVITEIIPAW
jgi:hypothetical protein